MPFIPTTSPRPAPAEAQAHHLCDLELGTAAPPHGAALRIRRVCAQKVLDQAREGAPHTLSTSRLFRVHRVPIGALTALITEKWMG